MGGALKRTLTDVTSRRGAECELVGVIEVAGPLPRKRFGVLLKAFTCVGTGKGPRFVHLRLGPNERSQQPGSTSGWIGLYDSCVSVHIHHQDSEPHKVQEPRQHRFCKRRLVFGRGNGRATPRRRSILRRRERKQHNDRDFKVDVATWVGRTNWQSP